MTCTTLSTTVLTANKLVGMVFAFIYGRTTHDALFFV